MFLKKMGINTKPYKYLHFTGKCIESVLNWEGEEKVSKDEITVVNQWLETDKACLEYSHGDPETYNKFWEREKLGITHRSDPVAGSSKKDWAVTP